MDAIPIVGRSVELERLSLILSTMDDRRLKTVLITGGPGIGKTRFAQEGVNEASALGWQIWKGHADPINSKTSFSILLQIFRVVLTRMTPDERIALSSAIPAVSELLPEFYENLSAGKMDVRWDRTRLFETFRSITFHLSHHQPTIIWIDDFPDSDLETIEWIHYLMQQDEGMGVLFLATCRTPIAEDAHAYFKLCNTLYRSRQLEEIELRALDLQETEALVRHIVAADVHERVPRLLHQRTSGIPLFTVELIRLLQENGDLIVHDDKFDIRAGTEHHVPKAVASVISQRVDNLSDLQKQILSFIAISNLPLPWGILLKCTETEAQLLAKSLSQLVRLSILDERSFAEDMEYTFSHPMVQQVVSSEISETMSRYLHHLLAMAWRENHVRAAHHILLSGSIADIKEAVTILVEAGIYHLSMRAYGTAREHLEAAVSIVDKSLESITLEVEQNAKILLCEAWAYSERVSDALELLSELLQDASSPSWRIRVKRLMARIESTRSVFNCIEHIEDGLRLWDGQSENEDVFWMLNEQIFNYLNSDAIAEAERTLTALQNYCYLHPSVKHSLVLDIRQAHIQVFDWRTGYPLAPEVGHLTIRARELGEPEWIYDAYGLLGYSSLNQGDHITTVRYWKECIPLVKRYGMVTYEYSIIIMGACGLFLAGEWEEALEQLVVVERMAREYSIDLAVAVALDLEAVIYALRGRWSKARSCVVESKEIMSRSLVHTPVSDDVRDIHAVTALEIISQGTNQKLHDSISVVWANAHGFPIFLKLLEGIVHIRSGNIHSVRRIIDEFHCASRDDVNYAKGVANLLGGLLDHQLGQTSEALVRIENAIHTFEYLELPLESAMARLEWSTLCARKRPEDAEACVKLALMTFQRLDAKSFIERAKDTFQMIQAQRTETMLDTGLDDLSHREREIVVFISKGLSNKEIADTLTISRRTVDTHVNNIFKKLDVHSRTALLYKLHLR